MAKMYLYLVERTDKGNYDSYDSFIVCCESKKVALKCHPSEWMALLTHMNQSSTLVGQHSKT